MRDHVLNRLLTALCRVGMSAVVAVAALLATAPARAASTPVAFTLWIYGNGNTPTVALQNESRLPISRLELTIGNYDRSWDYASNFRGGVSDASVTVNSPDRSDSGSWADTIDVSIGGGGLAPGRTMYFNTDVDGNSSNDGGQNFRTVLFNNGQDKPNATAKVTLSNGKSAMITLPDGAADLYLYRFESEARPRTVEVESVAELGGDDRVSRVSVTIDGVVPEVLGQSGVLATNIGERVRIRAFDGEKVAVSAPREVYKNVYGDDITDSIQNDPKIIEDEAQERFTALGISVNDVAQSGDPTYYSFNVDADTSVAVKWQHEFALVVEHDFARTESQEQDSAGKPWAGPLTSDAEGNPDPPAKKNWFRRGETVVAQVDGQVLDFNRAGLDVRSVPVGYVAGGPPNRTTNPSDDQTTRTGRLIPAQILDPSSLVQKLRASSRMPSPPISGVSSAPPRRPSSRMTHRRISGLPRSWASSTPTSLVDRSYGMRRVSARNPASRDVGAGYEQSLRGACAPGQPPLDRGRLSQRDRARATERDPLQLRGAPVAAAATAGAPVHHVWPGADPLCLADPVWRPGQCR